MTRTEIQAAIQRADKGIKQYQELMRMLPTVDVSMDRDFQRRYNGLYRVRSRPLSWYPSYYALMQKLKLGCRNVEFAQVLDDIHAATGRYEPSFSSKLVATLDPLKPVWDTYVLSNLGHRPPAYGNKNKLALAKDSYRAIEQWYAQFLSSADGLLCIREFDSLVENHSGITDVKKVDFILWQMR